ncbi:asparagine synthase (glutamine-hydrolyzing) [Fulvivirga sp. 29W222]|uniref:asparagine synthase (glutamine-hydrolyzing) n=1 Tax=Fulvivirga marina TaxID=2494733 RepID=A0A937KE53_9BACT|nr:asparagine synthase (glutamine-hydrolyzing) [Fulvivirga marina]MBL6446868.1 asparagine synthase (glutamine-hydrolyzing) [Fulvivirga marina]
MCGIAGLYGYGLVEQQHLKRITRTLSHRGPDAEGYFIDEQVALGHRRLAIIDLEPRANQPMTYEEYTIVLNGEIYNYREVRQELKGLGYSFSSESDTEVLLKAFSKWGIDAVAKLVGMFSFAIYNSKTRELCLVRDRLGVKPLYYHYSNGRLIFGSEIKVISEHFDRSLEVDKSGLYSYLRFGYFIGETTIFAQVKKVPPGSYIRITPNNLSIQHYWCPEGFLQDKKSFKNIDSAADELEPLLIEAFKYRMVSDVPVGTFFSGGIDSSLLVAILNKHYGKIITCTIGFDKSQNNEAEYARKIAKHLGTIHHERILGFSEARDLFSSFYDVYDEPFHDTSGIPTSIVTELAKERGIKVVLSADGGDELFGGYPVYKKLSSFYNRVRSIPAIFRQTASRIVEFMGVDSSGLYYRNMGQKMGKVAELLESESAEEVYEAIISTISHKEAMKQITGELTFNKTRYNNNGLHPMERAMLWDLKYFLPDDLLVKVDRATMYHGIEGREPFLDHRVVEFALRLPLDYKIKNGDQKIILKKILARYMPPELYERPKQGFSIPLADWFAEYLDEGFQKKFSGARLAERFPMNEKVAKRSIDNYFRYRKKQQEYNTLHAFKLAGLLMWYDKHVGK